MPPPASSRRRWSRSPWPYAPSVTHGARPRLRFAARSGVGGLGAAPRVGGRHQTGADPERGDGEVQDVVRGVDRDQPDDVVAVDEAPDRDEQVDGAEAEGEQAGGVGAARERDAGDARQDVDEVVPAVDLEDDEVAALDVRA